MDDSLREKLKEYIAAPDADRRSKKRLFPERALTNAEHQFLYRQRRKAKSTFNRDYSEGLRRAAHALLQAAPKGTPHHAFAKRMAASIRKEAATGAPSAEAGTPVRQRVRVPSTEP